MKAGDSKDNEMLQHQQNVELAPDESTGNVNEYELGDHVRIALKLALKAEKPLLVHLLEMALLETD